MKNAYYIYIYRERERERDSTCMNLYKISVV